MTLRSFLVPLFALLVVGANSQNARRWKVLVIIPEQHINLRVPDPAVETAINRALIDAGYKVIDTERSREIIYNTAEELRKAGKGDFEQARIFAKKYGADIVVKGEAFSQEVQRRQVETDLGTVTKITCGVRAEVRAFRVDSAERVFYDSVQFVGQPDFTVELSSKRALEEAGDRIAPKLLAKLDKLAISKVARVELQIRNVSYGAGEQLRAALATVPGIREVQIGEFEAGVYQIEVGIDKATLPKLPGLLTTSKAMKRFKLQIIKAGQTLIVAKRG